MNVPLYIGELKDEVNKQKQLRESKMLMIEMYFFCKKSIISHFFLFYFFCIFSQYIY